MTKEEFREWLRGYLKAYPETSRWMNRLAVETKANLMESWEYAFKDVEHIEARHATADCVRGEGPDIPAYDRERTATILRKYILEKRARNAPVVDDPSFSRRLPEKRHVSLAALFRQISDEDVTREQRAEMLRSAFGDSQDPRDRYKCLVCRDVGKVDVWHPEYVMRVKALGMENAGFRYTSVVACTCQAGVPFKSRQRNALPEMNLLDHCYCRFGDTKNPVAIADMLDWIENSRQRYVEVKGESLFEEYNSAD